MGRLGVGCLLVALVVLVGVPTALFLIGRGYMVIGTVIAVMVGLQRVALVHGTAVRRLCGPAIVTGRVSGRGDGGAGIGVE